MHLVAVKERIPPLAPIDLDFRDKVERRRLLKPDKYFPRVLGILDCLDFLGPNMETAHFPDSVSLVRNIPYSFIHILVILGCIDNISAQMAMQREKVLDLRGERLKVPAVPDKRYLVNQYQAAAKEGSEQVARLEHVSIAAVEVAQDRAVSARTRPNALKLPLRHSGQDSGLSAAREAVEARHGHRKRPHQAS